MSIINNPQTKLNEDVEKNTAKLTGGNELDYDIFDFMRLLQGREERRQADITPKQSPVVPRNAQLSPTPTGTKSPNIAEPEELNILEQLLADLLSNSSALPTLINKAYEMGGNLYDARYPAAEPGYNFENMGEYVGGGKNMGEYVGGGFIENIGNLEKFSPYSSMENAKDLDLETLLNIASEGHPINKIQPINVFGENVGGTARPLINPIEYDE
tara:strand:+ start:749 stop:1390 length:642 start_codon:yes stop_codon:yes gene_type:complete